MGPHDHGFAFQAKGHGKKHYEYLSYMLEKLARRINLSELTKKAWTAITTNINEAIYTTLV